jgi:predicted Zn-dependent protease with MMP-like domain
MTRERFVKIVQQTLDGLPGVFRERIVNVAVLVEDYPPGQEPRRAPRPRALERERPRRLLMGQFIGTPATQKSVFAVPRGPDHIVLYQKNIEAVCRTEAEIRHEIRQTVMHELGHYFGLDEDALADV